jgi:Family of unknown function (DUF6169)
MSYSFFFEGGLDNSYYFETNDGIIYEVIFKPTPYLFGNEKSVFSDLIFEFSILVEFNPNKKLPAADSKIGATTAEIFNDFYFKKGNAITIYICDSSDDKQSIRKRKFDIWFTKYNDVRFFKIDKVLIDNHKKRFPISLILSDSNPYKTEIIDSFTSMIVQNNENK